MPSAGCTIFLHGGSQRTAANRAAVFLRQRSWKALHLPNGRIAGDFDAVYKLVTYGHALDLPFSGCLRSTRSPRPSVSEPAFFVETAWIPSRAGKGSKIFDPANPRTDNSTSCTTLSHLRVRHTDTFRAACTKAFLTETFDTDLYKRTGVDEYAGPEMEDMIYASPGGFARWTRPEGTEEGTPNYKLPVHVQNIENLKALCRQISEAAMHARQRHLVRAQPIPGWVVRRNTFS